MNGKVKKLSIQEAVANIWQWGIDRNITQQGGASVVSQISKAAEEVMELSKAYYSQDHYDTLVDAEGDILTCLIQAMRLDGMDLLQVTMLIQGAAKFEYVHDMSKDKILEELNSELFLSCADGHLVMMHVVGVLLNLKAFSSRLDPFVGSLNMAWYAIKDRKGTMIAGKFVKEQPQEQPAAEGEK
jgi:hypothetical protein